MNYLAIDYGTKNIGLAVSTLGVISPIPVIKNDDHIFDNLKKIITDYKIDGIYVGISEGEVATLTKAFVEKLKSMLKLNIETVEEAVSTIEAQQIYIQNKNKKKDYKKLIDSVAAAVILRRVTGY
ncbi:MAG: Holliday junction resolvase RuvX [Candidatus Shapirobacteria bacterium]|nr:Holliday junction resolvase RuvX [Candidatus Shapirobacteria bacterium]MDD4383055.1 Holliday junction resolvase RuvX [Candidatus Shapirobacteria bacterium]